MRRAMYSASLRATGQVLLGASVLFGARALLALSPAGLLVISTLLQLSICGMWGPFATSGGLGTRYGALVSEVLGNSTVLR